MLLLMITCETVKSETAISPPIFSLFLYFFGKIKDHTSTNNLTQKSRFEEKYQSEGIL